MLQHHLETQSPHSHHNTRVDKRHVSTAVSCEPAERISPASLSALPDFTPFITPESKIVRDVFTRNLGNGFNFGACSALALSSLMSGSFMHAVTWAAFSAVWLGMIGNSAPLIR